MGAGRTCATGTAVLTVVVLVASGLALAAEPKGDLAAEAQGAGASLKSAKRQAEVSQTGDGAGSERKGGFSNWLPVFDRNRIDGKVYNPDYVIVFDNGDWPFEFDLLPEVRFSFDRFSFKAASLRGRLAWLPAEGGALRAAAGYQDIAHFLVGLARHPGGHVRHRAIRALGLLGDARAVPVLVEGLRDDYRVTQAWYYQAAWPPGVTESALVLGYPLAVGISSFARGGSTNSDEAAEALINLGASEAVPPVVALLADKTFSDKGLAVWALRGIGTGQVVPVLQRTRDEATEAGDNDLVGACEEAMLHITRRAADEESLIRQLGEEDPRAVYEAMQELVSRRCESALPVLESLFADPRRIWTPGRDPSLVALIGTMARWAAASIREGSSGPRQTAREQGASVGTAKGEDGDLGPSGRPSAVPPNPPAMKHIGGGARAPEYVMIFDVIDKPIATDFWADGGDEMPYDRFSFKAFSLCELLRPMPPWSTDERQAEHPHTAAGYEDVADFLIRQAEHPSHSVRNRAIRALGLIANRQAIPALVAALQDEGAAPVSFYLCARLPEDQPAEGAAPDPVEYGTGLTLNAREAAEALGSLGAVEAVPALVALLRDADCRFKDAVADALGQVATAEAVPVLQEARDAATRAGDSDLAGWCERGILQIRARAADESALVGQLEDEDAAAVYYAMQELVRRRSEAAVPHLERLFDDAREIRTTAGLPAIVTTIGTMARWCVAAIRNGTVRTEGAAGQAATPPVRGPMG